MDTVPDTTRKLADEYQRSIDEILTEMHKLRSERDAASAEVARLTAMMKAVEQMAEASVKHPNALTEHTFLHQILDDARAALRQPAPATKE